MEKIGGFLDSVNHIMKHNNKHVYYVVLTRIVLLKEVHFLLQEGVKQQLFQSLVQSGQGAHKYASSKAGEQSAVGWRHLK